jgi:hypothetical protein
LPKLNQLINLKIAGMLSYILTSCHQFLYMVLICFVKIYVNLYCSCFFTSVKYKMCMTRQKSNGMLIELIIDSENQLYKGLDIFVTLHFFEELEVWVFSCELQFMFLSRCNARASFLVCKKKHNQSRFMYDRNKPESCKEL